MKYFIVFLLSIIWFNGYACSCFPTPLSAKKIVDSELVIKGEIVAKKEIGLQPGQDKENTWIQNHFEYTVRVSKVIKGLSPKTEIKVYSSTSGASCGVNYQKGDKYYFFIGSRNGNYQTGLCSGNIHVKRVTKKQKRVFRKYRCMWNSDKHIDTEGNLVAEGVIKRRVPIGEWKFYYKNGELNMLGQFENGLKHGEWVQYYSEENWEEFAKANKIPTTPFEERIRKIYVFKKGVRLDTKFKSVDDFK